MSANTLQLNFQNNSGLSGSIMVYQKIPNLAGNVFSVAWITKYTHPGSAVSFTWTTDYCFVWSETTELSVSTQCEAFQIFPAETNTVNSVELTYTNGAFSFGNPQNSGMPGMLQIIQDSSIPPNQAMVGIGMSNAPTFLTSAQPNMIVTINAASEYWITFGNYKTGEIVDVTALANTVQVVYPYGVTTMNAILNQDNILTVSA